MLCAAQAVERLEPRRPEARLYTKESDQMAVPVTVYSNVG